MYNTPFNGLPPPAILQSLIDLFFLHVHDRPYSYLQEASFRQKLTSASIPNYLLLSVISAAVRFSADDYYRGKIREATQAYAKESWVLVLMEYMMVDESPRIEVIQTLNLLAIADYTAGRLNPAWMKVGLAMRTAQTMRLMSEPFMSLDSAEQEERRGSFWSIYLLDRLISCAKWRPLAIQDDKCTLRLPCEEDKVQGTYSLHELLSWDCPSDVSPSPFALVILTASIFGRCTKYIYSQRDSERIPPWHTDSEMSRLGSLLLLLELFSPEGGPEGGQVLFARILFHLCHCLLNHPIVVRSRLERFVARAPVDFTRKARQAARAHAIQLTDLLGGDSRADCLFEFSFYPCCIVVAGGIHAVASHWPADEKTNPPQPNAAHYARRSISMLEQLAGSWQHAASMLARLNEFIGVAHVYSTLLEPAWLAMEICVVEREQLLDDDRLRNGLYEYLGGSHGRFLLGCRRRPAHPVFA